MISTLLKKCCRLLLLMPILFDLALAVDQSDISYAWPLKLLLFFAILVVLACMALCRLNEEEMNDLMRNDSIVSEERTEGFYDLEAVNSSSYNMRDNSLSSYRNALWSNGANQPSESEHRTDATSLSNKSMMDDDPPSYESVIKGNLEFNENQQKFGKSVQRF